MPLFNVFQARHMSDSRWLAETEVDRLLDFRPVGARIILSSNLRVRDEL